MLYVLLSVNPNVFKQFGSNAFNKQQTVWSQDQLIMILQCGRFFLFAGCRFILLRLPDAIQAATIKFYHHLVAIARNHLCEWVFESECVQVLVNHMSASLCSSECVRMCVVTESVFSRRLHNAQRNIKTQQWVCKDDCQWPPNSNLYQSVKTESPHQCKVGEYDYQATDGLILYVNGSSYGSNASFSQWSSEGRVARRSMGKKYYLVRLYDIV